MEIQTLFWSLIVIAVIQAIGLYMIGQSIKTLLASKTFRKRLLKREQGEGDIKRVSDTAKKIVGVTILIVASGLYNHSFATSVVADTVAESSSFYNRTAINVLVGINIVLASMLFYARSIFRSFFKESVPTAYFKKQKKQRRVKINKILTDAVPLSEEESILLHHDYDGITELDNNLPPWWKWGFYLSIVVGIFYLINYHVLKISPLQHEEYSLAMLEAEEEVAAYLKEQALNVDENTVVFLEAETDINAGKSLFTQYCVACHLEGGAGVVGPNLTDDYWIYGDKINDVFKTIKYGANNGMKSWKDELNPVQMQQVASYILTLRGTNPPNAKAPEGDYYPPAEVQTNQDSTAQEKLTQIQ